MHKTLLGGVSALRKRHTLVRKSFITWKKSQRKTAAILSLCFRLSIIALPLGALPASTLATQHASIAIQDLTLDRSQSIFSENSTPIGFKPGESNTTIEAHRLFLVARPSAPVTLAPAPSLDEMRQVYKDAGDKYGVPSQLIEAVHQVETGKSWDTAKRSGAGAVGPMQFLPSTFHSYCTRTGEGCTISSADDSIFAASLLLSANFNGSWDQAILAYNHSLAYVARVKNIANQLGADI